MVKFITIFVIGLCYSLNCFAQKEKAIKLNLELSKNNLSKYKDFEITLNFTCLEKNKAFLIPTGFIYDFDSDIKPKKTSNIVFLLEKLVKKKYTKQITQVDNHTTPYFYPSNIITYDTLSFQKGVAHKFNIIGYYLFKKGKYRIRAKFIVPEIDKLKEKYIFSDWLYFEVTSYPIDYSDLQSEK